MTFLPLFGLTAFAVSTVTGLVSALLWLVALLVAGTAVLFLGGDHLRRTVEVVTNETGRAAVTGIAGWLTVVPALAAVAVGLAITIIGIFFIPIAVGAVLLGVAGISLLGFLAVAQVVGAAIAGHTRSETSAGRELQHLFTGILGFLSLWIVAAALAWMPLVGTLLRVLAASVTFVAVTTGFGAVILSWWRRRRRANAVAL